jgi:energy-converting hydrogenase Eha subunit B
VRFHVEGPLGDASICHCRMCQKAFGGFFGPLVLAPEANQGPLLGIFITGPLGFILGGVIGLIVAFVRERG